MMSKSLNHNLKRAFAPVRKLFYRTRSLLDGSKALRSPLFWIFMTALALSGHLAASRIAVVVSPSLPYRIFILERSGRIPKWGDYVLFTLSSPLFDHGRRHRAMKRVSGVTGQVLTVDRKLRFFYCDGHFLGVAKSMSLKGQPLPMFEFNGKIPGGFLFVTGSHHDSFDSRYWGLLEVKNVQAIAHPLF